MVNRDGSVNVGVFSAPFRTLNPREARFDWAGVDLPRALVQLRLKEFQHIGVIAPEFYFGIAIVDAQYLGAFFCYLVDRRSGELLEYKAQSLFGGRQLPANCWNDQGYFRAGGVDVVLLNQLDQGCYRIVGSVASRAGQPAVQIDLTCYHDLSKNEPLVAVMPFGENRVAYAHKAVMPTSGRIVVGERVVICDPATCLALLDEHKALYPRHQWWHWATFAGYDASGQTLAINLTHNGIADDERYNECAFWIDGALHLLAAARFTFDPTNHLMPWQIATTDGAVNLVFEPQGERKEDLDFGLAKSFFHQPYGLFKGKVNVAGREIAIDRLFGLCEAHEAVW